MMKYRHCKRSGIAFVLLGVITFGIYPIVVLSHVQKEVESLTEKNGMPKQIPFVEAFFLGWITFEIVPLVWLAKMAGKIQVAALERKVTSPRISKAFIVLWLIFGSEIIIGPFVAFHRFFKVLNAVEKRENERIDTEGKNADAKAEMESEMQGEEGNEKTQLPAEPEPSPETPYPNLPSSANEEPKKEIPSQKPASEGNGRPWRVRIGSAVKVFSSREEAVSYAKKISAERRALSQKGEKKE